MRSGVRSPEQNRRAGVAGFERWYVGCLIPLTHTPNVKTSFYQIVLTAQNMANLLSSSQISSSRLPNGEVSIDIPKNRLTEIASGVSVAAVPLRLADGWSAIHAKWETDVGLLGRALPPWSCAKVEPGLPFPGPETAATSNLASTTFTAAGSLGD